jgi:hypothetical protein
MGSIPGLEEKHRRALASKLGITSLRALADADQRAVYTALASFRPRPSLERVEAWQDEARGRLSDAANGRSAWHTAASFAVIFAQRQVDGRWERRLEAEQTEVEPEPEPRQWPGWDCKPLCDWMIAQLGLPEGEAEAAAQAPAAAQAAAAAAAERAELRIDRATITDASHDLDLISAGHLVTVPPDDLRHPVRMRVTVRGGRSGQRLRAAVWFRRPDGPGWSPQEPVTVSASGQAEFDLSSVPAGGHDVRLLAWATDPGATLAAVSLPTLTFSGLSVTVAQGALEDLAGGAFGGRRVEAHPSSQIPVSETYIEYVSLPCLARRGERREQ